MQRFSATASFSDRFLGRANLTVRLSCLSVFVLFSVPAGVKGVHPQSAHLFLIIISLVFKDSDFCYSSVGLLTLLAAVLQVLYSRALDSLCVYSPRLPCTLPFARAFLFIFFMQCLLFVASDFCLYFVGAHFYQENIFVVAFCYNPV